MLSKKMEKSLNEQINTEFYSAYLYLSMAAYLEEKDLRRMGHWMQKHFQEETQHAIKIYSYIIDRRGKIRLNPIREVPIDWKSPLHVFEEMLRHEQQVTTAINKLYNQAEAERDHATAIMLEDFINEQVEEESTIGLHCYPSQVS
ncbi:MAG: ferritin [Lentisphaerae bacterium]|nr:ferritin [Lentisphaerota bacterium]MCP4100622.1 ferritin [Lentisphaerota bacterium]